MGILGAGLTIWGPHANARRGPLPFLLSLPILSLPSFPLLSPSFPFSLFPLEVGPLKSSWGSGAQPHPKSILVHFSL